MHMSIEIWFLPSVDLRFWLEITDGFPCNTIHSSALAELLQQWSAGLNCRVTGRWGPQQLAVPQCAQDEAVDMGQASRGLEPRELLDELQARICFSQRLANSHSRAISCMEHP